MATRRGFDLIQQMNNLHVTPGHLAIWGLGQMGVALKGASQQVIYIDPVLTDVAAIKSPGLADKFARAFPPPLEGADITHASYVLCTHEHNDHTDPLTLGPLAKASPQAHFVVSGWAHSALDEAEVAPQRRIVPTVGQPLDLDGIRIHAIPAAHYELERDEQRGFRYLSFLVEFDGVAYFHGGDGILYPEYAERLRALPKADVGMVATNGRDAYRESFGIIGNMLPLEAVWLAKELEWDVLIGGHNDLFLWNALRAGELADAVQHLNPDQKHLVLRPGQLYYYVC